MPIPPREGEYRTFEKFVKETRDPKKLVGGCKAIRDAIEEWHGRGAYVVSGPREILIHASGTQVIPSVTQTSPSRNAKKEAEYGSRGYKKWQESLQYHRFLCPVAEHLIPEALEVFEEKLHPDHLKEIRSKMRK